MKKHGIEDVNEICVELVSALGAWERGEPGAEARHRALRARLMGMGSHQASQPSHLQNAPALRLVPNCGSLLKARGPVPPTAA